MTTQNAFKLTFRQHSRIWFKLSFETTQFFITVHRNDTVPSRFWATACSDETVYHKILNFNCCCFSCATALPVTVC